MTIPFNLIMTAVVVVALALLAGSRTVLAWCAALAAVLFSAATLVLLLPREHLEWANLTAHAVFVHLLVFFAASAILLRKRSRLLAIGSAATAVVLVLVVVDAFLIEPIWLDVSHVRIASPKLKQPVRIVLLADLQADRFGAYERRVLQRAVEEKPDLILWAGDYMQVRPEQRRQLRGQINDFLRQLDFRPPQAAFAVRGILDHLHWDELFEGLPLAVATIEQTQGFEVAGLHLTCLGRDDSDDKSLLLKAPPPPGRFHLMLGYSPLYALGPCPADLCLAGHTHGGQVCLPLLGPLTTFCDVPRRYAAGLLDRPAGGRLLVSRGIGMERAAAPQMRLLCRPELVVVELVPE